MIRIWLLQMLSQNTNSYASLVGRKQLYVFKSVADILAY